MLKDVVEYIIYYCNQKKLNLGAIKLNKILWFYDTNNYKKTGESLTKEKYVKQKFGPVPQHILNCLKELENSHIIKIEKIKKQNNNNYQKTNYYYNKGTFDKKIEQQQELDALIENICNNFSASQISEKTHDNIWRLAKISEEIPLYAILANDVLEIDDDDVEWMANNGIKVA